MYVRCKLVASIALGLIAVLIGGCASRGVNNRPGRVVEMRVDEKAGPGIQPQDIGAVADQMAQGIMGVPEIARAESQLRIVLLPVKNDTGSRLNRRFLQDQITAQLNERLAGRVRFSTRDAISKQEKRTANYEITGKLVAETGWTSEGMSHYLLYTFELVDPNTREIIWSGSHRIRKQRP